MLVVNMVQNDELIWLTEWELINTLMCLICLFRGVNRLTGLVNWLNLLPIN